mmetsp:Transcript_59005/g.117224  ORF Transcript_59005/g.117224 Transcript_59005/m.117224 type:complete len:276 (+) Transcript_59005:299-1126(+)
MHDMLVRDCQVGRVEQAGNLNVTHACLEIEEDRQCEEADANAGKGEVDGAGCAEVDKTEPHEVENGGGANTNSEDAIAVIAQRQEAVIYLGGDADHPAQKWPGVRLEGGRSELQLKSTLAEVFVGRSELPQRVVGEIFARLMRGARAVSLVTVGIRAHHAKGRGALLTWHTAVEHRKCRQRRIPTCRLRGWALSVTVISDPFALLRALGDTQAVEVDVPWPRLHHIGLLVGVLGDARIPYHIIAVATEVVCAVHDAARLVVANSDQSQHQPRDNK